MKTFIKKENVPSVIRFKGKDIKLSIGFRILKNTARNIPPIIKVIYPPLTLTPGSIKVKRKSENPLIAEFLIKDLIYPK